MSYIARGFLRRCGDLPTLSDGKGIASILTSNTGAEGPSIAIIAPQSLCYYSPGRRGRGGRGGCLRVERSPCQDSFFCSRFVIKKKKKYLFTPVSKAFPFFPPLLGEQNGGEGVPAAGSLGGYYIADGEGDGRCSARSLVLLGLVPCMYII